MRRLLGVRSTPALPQWHVKDPSHSAKVRVAGYTQNMRTLITHQVRVGWLCRCPGIAWEPIRKQLTCNLSGNISQLSSQLAEPPWFHPGIKGGISVHELIHFKKNVVFLNAQVGNEWSNILPKSSQASKKPKPLQHMSLMSWLGTREHIWAIYTTVRARPMLIFAQDGAFTSAIWTRLESEVLQIRSFTSSSLQTHHLSAICSDYNSVFQTVDDISISIFIYLYIYTYTTEHKLR